MVKKTSNHELNKYEEGETNWTHSPDMETIEERLVIRDNEDNLENYTPHSGAIFIATDTGTVYDGNGESWHHATRDLKAIGADKLKRDLNANGYNFTEVGTISTEAVNTIKMVPAEATQADIQYAIDTVSDRGGGIIVLDAGDYWINEAINIPSKCWLIGQGGGTTIHLEDEANTDIIKVKGDYAYVRRLTLEGNRSNQSDGTSHALVFEGETYNSGARDVVIGNAAGSGVHAYNYDGNNYELHLVNIQVFYCNHHGFELRSAGDLFSAHCYSDGCSGDGIVDSTGYSTYLHPHGFDNTHGMFIEGSAMNVQILGPHYENNHKEGLVVNGINTTVSAPVCYENSQEESGEYPDITLDTENTYIYGGHFHGASNTNAAIVEKGNSTKNAIIGCIAQDHTNDPYQLIGPETKAIGITPSFDTHHGLTDEDSDNVISVTFDKPYAARPPLSFGRVGGGINGISYTTNDDGNIIGATIDISKPGGTVDAFINVK